MKVVTMTELIHDLKILKHGYGVVGIKQSFEDEGVVLDDVITMRRITELAGLKLYIKIGGCEANSDINTCEKLGVDAIIAPMIESEFAMKKYVEASQHTSMEKYFVCETKTAGQNIDKIIESSQTIHPDGGICGFLDGVVIGRSDYCKSLDLSKSEVNSPSVAHKIECIAREIKRKGLFVTMGGNISIDSVDLIEHLYSENLLDKIETRNVVIDLRYGGNGCTLDEALTLALDFEIKWLKYKAQNYLRTGNSYLGRADLLEKRK